jgi:hypothetical protein
MRDKDVLSFSYWFWGVALFIASIGLYFYQDDPRWLLPLWLPTLPLPLCAPPYLVWQAIRAESARSRLWYAYLFCLFIFLFIYCWLWLLKINEEARQSMQSQIGDPYQRTISELLSLLDIERDWFWFGQATKIMWRWWALFLAGSAAYYVVDRAYGHLSWKAYVREERARERKNRMLQLQRQEEEDKNAEIRRQIAEANDQQLKEQAEAERRRLAEERRIEIERLAIERERLRQGDEERKLQEARFKLQEEAAILDRKRQAVKDQIHLVESKIQVIDAEIANVRAATVDVHLVDEELALLNRHRTEFLRELVLHKETLAAIS